MEQQRTDDETGLERRYTNFLRIGFNQTEFLLDFAQLYEGVTPVLHTHLVASPFHANRFVELLHSCVHDYTERYGAIAPPQEP